MALESEMKVFRKDGYVRSFITKDLRPDGRSISETRPLVIHKHSIGTADGSALVKLGNTIVVCGIKLEITRPPAEEQDCGVFIINVQLPPLCSSKFKPGAPSNEAQSLSSQVTDLIKISKIVERTRLSILPGRYCWILNIDVLCCNYDGNILDAAFISTIAALHDLQIPETSYDEESDDIVVNSEQRHKLDINVCPTPLSYTIFDDKILLPDPTFEEESVSDGRITIITNNGEDINHVTKVGGASINMKQLELAMIKLKDRFNEVHALIVTD